MPSNPLSRLVELLQCDDSEVILDFCAEVLESDECKRSRDEVAQWQVLQATLEPEPRVSLLRFLGFDPDNEAVEVCLSCCCCCCCLLLLLLLLLLGSFCIFYQHVPLEVLH